MAATGRIFRIIFVDGRDDRFGRECRAGVVQIYGGAFRPSPVERWKIFSALFQRSSRFH